MAKTPPKNPREISGLLGIMADLRSKEGGCPWDVEQDYRSIAPYTIEEAYEVADAIERNDLDDLKEELGDLLLQVVFHAQIASEEGRFTFADVVEGICTKMVRRHPHVFVDGQDQRTAEEQTIAWEEIKSIEKREKGTTQKLLDDVPVNLPGLTRAVKLQKRAAKVGFDWPEITQVLDKVEEEAKELVEARDTLTQEKVEEEYGDLLFVLANLGRHLKVDPEGALRTANEKFRRRFDFIEEKVEAGPRSWKEYTLEELEDIWQEAKKHQAVC